MSNTTIEMSGRLLLFDVVDKNNTRFSKDCKLLVPKTVPVTLEFDDTDICGVAHVQEDEKGLTCDVKLVNFEHDLLHSVFNNQLYVGGLYNDVETSTENDVTVINSGRLRAVGITQYPANDELKIILKK